MAADRAAPPHETSAGPPVVGLFVASRDTAPATELCVRSARRLAGHPFVMTVGDSGSTDGSAEMLERLARRGWLTLERRAGARHAEWIDGWRATSRADLLVFADSDVEFRRMGWLRDMVAEQARTGAALVAAELLGESPDSFNPVALTRVRGMVRAAPWLLMIDRRQTAGIATSFLYDEYSSADVPEGNIAYDVGARFYEAVVAAGLVVHEMPRRHRRTWHHYAGLSWVPLHGPRGRKKRRDLRVVERRLRRLARAQDRPTRRARAWLALASAPALAAGAEVAAKAALRVRAGPDRRRRSAPE